MFEKINAAPIYDVLGFFNSLPESNGGGSLNCIDISSYYLKKKLTSNELLSCFFVKQI